MSYRTASVSGYTPSSKNVLMLVLRTSTLESNFVMCDGSIVGIFNKHILLCWS